MVDPRNLLPPALRLVEQKILMLYTRPMICATFTILGVDSENGDLGVAVASRFLAVGSLVPYARAKAGVFATQHNANPAFGTQALRMLEAHEPPQTVLQQLLANDTSPENRQLAVLNPRGEGAVYTGEACAAWAGAVSGQGYICIGNTLSGEQTVTAMERAFLETEGRLWDRLMAALGEGERAGGDKRGKQAAALLVVRAGGGYLGQDDRLIDLRVDDHADPIGELRRILNICKRDYLIQK